MTRTWEVRLSHDEGVYVKIGSVFVAEGADIETVKAAAEDRFGGSALAVRPADTEEWTDI